MKLSNNTKLMWTIFKLEREESGKYTVDLGIDIEWVERQIKKLKKEKRGVCYVVADSYAEMVYNIKLSSKEKAKYLRQLTKKLENESNFQDVVFESDMLDEFWTFDEYFDIATSYVPDGEILSKEKKTRSKLYNSNGYQISSEEISKIATMAVGCFKAEACLEMRYYQKEFGN